MQVKGDPYILSIYITLAAALSENPKIQDIVLITLDFPGENLQSSARDLDLARLLLSQRDTLIGRLLSSAPARPCEEALPRFRGSDFTY